jgi:hypothetical protein
VSSERNVEEIQAFEFSLRDRLNAANAEGPAIVYPVAIRTRYCACPDNAPTDCRFHSRTEPGWEICPEITDSNQIGALKKGRWLYITTGEPVNQDDPTEAQDNALAERLSNELIKAVQ